MERKELPKELRDKLNRLRIPTAEEQKEIIKRLTREQRGYIQALITDVFAKAKRSRFKLIRGGRSMPSKTPPTSQG